MSAKGGKQGRKPKIASEIEMARWMGGMETEMKYRATTPGLCKGLHLA